MGYHCIVTAAARLAKESPENFVQRLTHDGSGTFPDSDVVKTHHIQEIVDGLLDRGVALCPIELVPVGTHMGQQFVILFPEVEDNFDRFRKHLKGNQGIILGMMGPIGHAVYWDGEHCFDSRGQWELWKTDFNPSEFWRAVWM